MSQKLYDGPSKKIGDYGYNSENARSNSRGPSSHKSKTDKYINESNSKKVRRSAKIGMILAFIQLLVSVIFIGLLVYKKLYFTITILATTIAVLIIFFGFALFMQQKGSKSRTTGKVVSILMTIILLIGTYMIYPIDPMNGKQLTDSPFVVFVSGSNNYEGSARLSDTNILAIVNPKTYTVLMVSTPRDYFIPIVAKGVMPGSRDKLTHLGLYGNGIAKDSNGNEINYNEWNWAQEKLNEWQPGYDVLMDSLASLYDIDIPKNNYHYARINFTGFADLIDALGGIEVDVDTSFSTRTYASYGETDNGERKTYVFNKGPMKMDGDTALTFARERKSFGSGDIQRNKNQVKVINAVADKLISPSILTSWTSIVDSIEKNFTTDIDISSFVKLQLDINGKKDYDGWKIMSYSVTGTPDRGQLTWNGLYKSVVLEDEESISNASTLIDMVLDGTDPTTIEAKIKDYQDE